MKIKDKIFGELNELIEKGPITIVAFGDSVTHGALGVNEINYETVYWNLLKQKLNKFRNYMPVNVINAGIGGITANNSLARMDSQVLKHEPDLIIVCFGLNDVNGELDTYLNALREIFKKGKESGAEVIFLTPNMLNTYVAKDTYKGHLEYAAKTAEMQNSGRMDKYMDAAVKLAEEMGVSVCDCYKKWKKLSETEDTTLLLSNRINHPIPEMHHLFADSLFEMIMGDVKEDGSTDSTMYRGEQMYTKEQLKEDLLKIGVCPGDMLMVHSSYKSLGGIEGGAKAVIEAFCEVLGENGTLLMPAFSYETVNFDNPFFDYEKSPNCVGYLGEYFRTEVKGVIRSVHATHSLCAWGRMSKELTENHEKDITPVGENSPITKLAGMGGKILMLGCSPDHLTIMHGVEETAEPDYLLNRENPIEYTLVLGDKTVKQKAIRHLFKKDGYYYHQKYSRIINLLDENEYKKGNILDASSYLFDAKAIWEKGGKKIKEESYYFIDKRSV